MSSTAGAAVTAGAPATVFVLIKFEKGGCGCGGCDDDRPYDLVGVYPTLSQAKAVLFQKVIESDYEVINCALMNVYECDNSGCGACGTRNSALKCKHKGVKCDECGEKSRAECGCGWWDRNCRGRSRRL